jgi:hypothetical protein
MAAQAGVESQPLDTPVKPAAKPKRRRGLAAALVTALLVGGGFAYNEYREDRPNFVVPTSAFSFETPTPFAVDTPTAFSFETPTSFAFDTPTAFAESTPTTFNNAQLLASDTFEDPLLSILPVFTAETQNGRIVDGLYEYTPPPQSASWVSATAYPFERGFASVFVTISGDGSAGLIGRERFNSDGTTGLETCWVTSAGAAGCSLLTPTGWQDYFTLPAGTAPLYGHDQLTMQIDQGVLIFWVNGNYIGQAYVEAGLSGNWGIIAGNYSGLSMSWFDDFSLTSYGSP